MGVKAQPRALLAQVPGVELVGDGRVRDVLRLRRHVLDQVRRDLGAPRRQQVRAHRGDAAPDAVVLGDLGCMLNIEGRLRRRGDAQTQRAARRRSARGRRPSVTERTMQVASMHFKERAHVKLHDAQLQRNLTKFKDKFVAKRRAARSPSSTTSRARAKPREAIRQRALDDLDAWLEIFERNATARGATVLWARDARRRQRARARHRGAPRRAQDHQVEVDGVRGVGARPRDRGAPGMTVVETDLGEYILQINDYEPPSHIIGPALHKSQGGGRRALPRASTARRARTASRSCASRRAACCAQHYLTADMGISGGNFFVAETGSVVLVTNEGNATLDDDAAEGARRDLGHREDRARRSRTSRR